MEGVRYARTGATRRLRHVDARDGASRAPNTRRTGPSKTAALPILFLPANRESVPLARFIVIPRSVSPYTS